MQKFSPIFNKTTNLCKLGVTKTALASLLLGASVQSFACTTIIVGKKASVNGAIMFGRNSDTSAATRAKHLKIYPHSDNQARFLALPYYNTEAKDGMLQVATNEYGVAMSATETITSNDATLKVDPYIESGVAEMDIVKPIMQQAKSAHDAVLAMGSMIEKRGSAEGFGVAVADKNEAWYLENAGGKHWVAVRIPDDAYFVSANQGRIQEVNINRDGSYADGYLGSHDLIDFAKQNGLYKQRNGKFDFRLSYMRIINHETQGLQNDIAYNYMRIATLQNKYSNKPLSGSNLKTGEFPTFLKPIHKLSENDVEQGLSNYYQATKYDPYTNSELTPVYRPISVFRSSNSHVTVVRDITDQNIANVEYIAMGMPSLSIYIPFYYGITKVPYAYTIGNGDADDDSAFWKFRKLQALVFTDFRHNEKLVRKAYDGLNKQIRADQLAMEAKYKKTHDPKIIQDFTDASVKKALLLTDNLTLQLENYYRKNHMQKVDFSNPYFTQLTNQVFNAYRFPGF